MISQRSSRSRGSPRGKSRVQRASAAETPRSATRRESRLAPTSRRRYGVAGHGTTGDQFAQALVELSREPNTRSFELGEEQGAAISASRPLAMTGQPCACSSVAPAKRRSNQTRTGSQNSAEASGEMPCIWHILVRKNLVGEACQQTR